jgi:hypothetical protein
MVAQVELGDWCRRCAAAAHRLLRALHPRIIHAPTSRREKIRVEPSWPILLICHLERAAGRNSEVRQVAKPNHVRHAASRQRVHLCIFHSPLLSASTVFRVIDLKFSANWLSPSTGAASAARAPPSPPCSGFERMRGSCTAAHVHAHVT